MNSALRHRMKLSTGLYLNGVQNLHNCSQTSVILPGGPGLSPEYLYEFSHDLQLQIEHPVMILELPWEMPAVPWNYLEIVNRVSSSLKELSITNTDINLIGHSLGAIIALDVVTSSLKTNFRTISLISTPANLESNPHWDESVKKLRIQSKKQEIDFESLLPLYFFEYSERWRQLLVRNYTPSAVPRCFDGFPLPNSIFSSKPLPELPTKLLFVEGENDIRIPTMNFDKLSRLLPNAEYKRIDRCGHFPMLEQKEKLLAICAQHIYQA